MYKISGSAAPEVGKTKTLQRFIKRHDWTESATIIVSKGLFWDASAEDLYQKGTSSRTKLFIENCADWATRFETDGYKLGQIQ